MANKEHLSILKNGVIAWNQWKSEHQEIIADLSQSDLIGANLPGINLIGADLSGVNLHGASLVRADLAGANLIGANLHGVNLHEANLIGANLIGADLPVANLTGVNLTRVGLGGANLFEADLSEANLLGADLTEAILNRAGLLGANLTNSIMWRTSLGDVDLSGVKGLESIRHMGPSSIGIDTIYKSKGKIPEGFLRGAGVSDGFITYVKSLLGPSIEFYSCYISYSHQDGDFAKRLFADLQREHVRCWFAPEDLKIGDKLRPKIDEAIRIYDKLLLILSENSIHSPWVKSEVETAVEKEIKQGKMVLFPIRLDDAVMKTDQAWAVDIRRQRHVGDFKEWKNLEAYRRALSQLVRDLTLDRAGELERKQA